VKAVKLIKLYAWEKEFARQISEVRIEEMLSIRRMEYLLALNTVMGFTVPSIVAFASFASFYFLEGKNVSIGKAFSTLTLFNVVKFPVQNFPIAMKAVSCFYRVHFFLPFY
jgi:ATP-binding cassette subfamily C (CFTR/MRP) protein 1